jgi:hypothetical protein
MLITHWWGLILCYAFLMMRDVATITLMLTDSDDPGVSISAKREFVEMEPLEQITMLIAAVKLCGSAITAIIMDNPDEDIDLEEMIESMDIRVADQELN